MSSHLNIHQEYDNFISLPPDQVIDHLISILKPFKELKDSQKKIFSKQVLELKQRLDISKEIDIRGCIYGSHKNKVNEVIYYLSMIGKCFTDQRGKMIHLLTDIDDTLIPNPSELHHISGSDYSDKKGLPYSGIKEFYKHIPTHPCIPYVTILSATPLILKKSRRDIYEPIIGPYAFLHGYESVHDIMKSVIHITKSNYDVVAHIKIQRFLEYRSLFPEYKVIFIGDNGQGDLIAGKYILDIDPDSLVFIHNIMDSKGNYKMTSTETMGESLNYLGRLYFFNDYLHLSKWFERRSLWSSTVVDKVKKAYDKDRQSRK